MECIENSFNEHGKLTVEFYTSQSVANLIELIQPINVYRDAGIMPCCCLFLCITCCRLNIACPTVLKVARICCRLVDCFSKQKSTMTLARSFRAEMQFAGWRHPCAHVFCRRVRSNRQRMDMSLATRPDALSSAPRCING